MAFCVPVVRKDFQLYGQRKKIVNKLPTSARASSKSTPTIPTCQDVLSDEMRRAMRLEARRRVHRRRSARLVSVSMSLRKISEIEEEDEEERRLELTHNFNSSVDEDSHSSTLDDDEEENSNHSAPAVEEVEEGMKKEHCSTKRRRFLRVLAWMNKRGWTRDDGDSPKKLASLRLSASS